MNDYYRKKLHSQYEMLDCIVFLIKIFIVASAVMFWHRHIFSSADGAVNATSTIATAPSSFVEYEANVSAYCPCSKCCGNSADGITANGHKIQPGDKFVAAPKDIPFGTMIDIPGYGRVPVLDRGGAIKGNKLDLYFLTHQEALNWGRKYIKVRMYIKDGDLL